MYYTTTYSNYSYKKGDSPHQVKSTDELAFSGSQKVTTFDDPLVIEIVEQESEKRKADPLKVDPKSPNKNIEDKKSRQKKIN